jgi:MFS family permease
MPEKLWNKNYTVLVLITFCSGLTAQLLNTALPLYMVNAMDSTATVSGLLSALYTIISCCCRPLSGILVDRYGRRRFLVAGLVVFAAGSFGFGFARTLSALVLFRALQGFGFGISATASCSFASDNIPQAQLGKGLGYLGMSNALPMVIGPSIALALVASGSYSASFVAGGVVLVVGLLLAFLTREDRRVFARTERKKLTWDSILEKHALPPSIIMFFLALAAACMMVYGTLFAQDRGYENASAFYLLSAIAMVLIRIPFQPLFDKVNGYFFVIPACLVWAAGYALMLAVRSPTLFLVSGVLYGGSLGLAQTMLNTIGLRGVPAERRGAANATFLLCFDGGIGLGAAGLGKLIDAASYSVMILVGIIALLIGALLGVAFALRGGGKVEPGPA